MESEELDGRMTVRLPAVLDLPAAAELRDSLLDMLAHDSAAEVVLEAAGVERISTAAVQVILAAAAGFRAAGRRFEVARPSPAAGEAFRLLGLSEHLRSLT